MAERSLVVHGVEDLAGHVVARRDLSFREIIGHTAAELAGLALLYASFQTNVSVIHIACYHFTFWALFPAVQMAGAKRYRGLAIYTVATVALTAAIAAIAPMLGGPATLSMTAFTRLFNLQSFIHITLAFVLSRTNPRFIVRAAEMLQRPVAIGPLPTA